MSMPKTTTLSGEVSSEEKKPDGTLVLKLKNVLMTVNNQGKREHEQLREVTLYFNQEKN